MKKTITIEDLAIMIKNGFEEQDQKFDQKLEKLDQKFDHKLEKLGQKFDHKLEKLGQKFDKKLKKNINNIVTKDYLDERLSDLRGDLVVLTRKEDTKMKKLISILSKKKIISKKETNELFGMEPFPELSQHLGI